MTADLTETVTIEGENITVSLLVWRRYKRPAPGVVERIFDLNRELAEDGAYMPVGTVVVMPVDTVNNEPKTLDPIRLW